MCAKKFLTVSTLGVLWSELCSLLSAERMCACPAAQKEQPYPSPAYGSGGGDFVQFGSVCSKDCCLS